MNRHIIRALVCAVSLVALPLAGRAQSANVGEAPKLLVTMPAPPDRLTRLDERCNYIVDNYWKTFNPKSSFSSLDRLDHTLGTFFTFTPYATADTVHQAIDYLIASVEKAGPNNLLTLAHYAEKWCGTDTSEYASEELYYPFVRAVALNKKVKGAERARYEHQFKQMEASRNGVVVPDFTFISPDGQRMHLADVTAPHVLLFFYEPDCIDCSLAKARLSADYVIQYMIRHNMLSIVALHPGVADGQWRESAASMPEGWIVGAMPDADDIFSIRHQPEIIYLDVDRRVQAKNVQVDNIIRAFRGMLGDMLNAPETDGGEDVNAATEQ